MQMYTKWAIVIGLLVLLSGCGSDDEQNLKGTYTLNKRLYLARENSFHIYTTNSGTTMSATLIIGPTSWKEKVVERDHPRWGNISTTTTGTYSGYSQGTATFTFSDGSKKIVHINHDSETRITMRYSMEYTIIPAFTLIETITTWDKVNNAY